ncbi:MAG TPA: hypothetical protein VGN28_04915 [Blastococcus sp.]|jgi:hypothetical protein|nr:hypothetical protein [Blastococcus sp.]
MSDLSNPDRPAQPADGGRPRTPAWRRPTRGEHRWPSILAITAAIVVQVLLPDRLILHPRWLLPGVEIVLAVGLIVANPVRLVRTHPFLRLGSLGLVAAMTVANAGSAALLVDRLLSGTAGHDARSLIVNGAAIYATNIVAFGLWYWELDRGGPLNRSQGDRQHTDFLFPQMTQPDVAPPDWEPSFLDYLYVSYTNATAFSPTDTMPLSRWAKMLMLGQSAIALATIALVVARAVNILS